MPILRRVCKPKTRKGKRFLEKREPRLIEEGKTTIFIRGQNANQTVLQALKDFSLLKKPKSVFFNKKNDLKPFEDASSFEFFSDKNDAALFMFGSHNKKRPNNLVLGRMYDYHVLDMYELGMENFKSLNDFKIPKIPTGTKPMLLFSGEMFNTDVEYQRLKNLLIDFFRGPVVGHIRPQGLEHIIMFNCVGGKIQFRSYKVVMTKSANKAPDVSLEEIGPHVDFVLRRRKLASDDLFKQATKVPEQLKPKKIKNVKRDPLGTTFGRVHMQRQDYSKLKPRKMKGLKGSRGRPKKKSASNEVVSPPKKMKQTPAEEV